MSKLNIVCPSCRRRYQVEMPNVPGEHTVRCPYCLAPFSATVTSAAERRARPSAPIGPDAVARNVRRCEIISSVAWLVIGVIQCVLVVSLAAGVWNVINAILCLRNVKNIVAHNSAVVPYFEQRRVWLIVLAVVNLVLGGVVGVVLVLVDWFVRDYVLRNRSAFEV